MKNKLDFRTLVVAAAIFALGFAACYLAQADAVQAGGGRDPLYIDRLVITDYIEFRWYVEGQCRETAILGALTDGQLRTSTGALAQVAGVLDKFLTQVLPTIGTPQQLAELLAAQAALVREAIPEWPIT